MEDDVTTMAALSVVATVAASLEPVRKQPREPSAEQQAKRAGKLEGFRKRVAAASGEDLGLLRLPVCKPSECRPKWHKLTDDFTGLGQCCRDDLPRRSCCAPAKGPADWSKCADVLPANDCGMRGVLHRSPKGSPRAGFHGVPLFFADEDVKALLHERPPFGYAVPMPLTLTLTPTRTASLTPTLSLSLILSLIATLSLPLLITVTGQRAPSGARAPAQRDGARGAALRQLRGGGQQQHANPNPNPKPKPKPNLNPNPKPNTNPNTNPNPSPKPDPKQVGNSGTLLQRELGAEIDAHDAVTLGRYRGDTGEIWERYRGDTRRRYPTPTPTP